MNDALPYRVSYAADKTKCQKCRHLIKQGALQIAIMVQVIFYQSVLFVMKNQFHVLDHFSIGSLGVEQFLLLCVFAAQNLPNHVK